MRKLVLIKDHGISTRTAERTEARLSSIDQQPTNTRTPPIGMHGEAIEVAAPAIPTGDNGPDQLATVRIDGKNQRLGISRDKGFDRPNTVGGTMRILGSHLPEGQNRSKIGGRGRAEFRSRHADDASATRGELACADRDVGREQVSGSRRLMPRQATDPRRRASRLATRAGAPDDSRANPSAPPSQPLSDASRDARCQERTHPRRQASRLATRAGAPDVKSEPIPAAALARSTSQPPSGVSREPASRRTEYAAQPPDRPGARASAPYSSSPMTGSRSVPALCSRRRQPRRASPRMDQQQLERPPRAPQSS